MGTIRIHDLKLRATVGTHAWERQNKQDLIVNMTIDYDAAKASQSDALKDALNYETMAAKVAETVERSHCLLLEKLAAKILVVILKDKRVQRATVRLDKPLAISYARSVSFELTATA